jgi:hypothetical protein
MSRSAAQRRKWRKAHARQPAGLSPSAQIPAATRAFPARHNSCCCRHDAWQAAELQGCSTCSRAQEGAVRRECAARRRAPPARRHPARAAPRTRVCRAHRVVARRSRMPLHMPPALQPQTAQQAAEISDALCRAASMRRENAAGYRTACAGARRPAACAPPERTRARRESQRQSGITACRGFVIDASLRPLPCPLAAPPSPPWPRKVRGKGRGMQSRPCPVPASCRTAGTLARAAASRARKLLRAANAVSQQ